MEVVFKTYYREPFTRVKLARAINEFKAKGGSLRELQYLMGHDNIFDTRRIFGTLEIKS